MCLHVITHLGLNACVRIVRAEIPNTERWHCQQFKYVPGVFWKANQLNFHVWLPNVCPQKAPLQWLPCLIFSSVVFPLWLLPLAAPSTHQSTYLEDQREKSCVLGFGFFFFFLWQHGALEESQLGNVATSLQSKLAGWQCIGWANAVQVFSVVWELG